LNNPQFGQGGLAQRFDPNFDFNCANGVLEKYIYPRSQWN